MSPKIHARFWANADIEHQPPEIKLAFLWLMSNSQTTILGTCRPTQRRFAFETGLDASWLPKLPEALPDAVRLVDGIYYMPTFIRNQLGSGQQLTKNTIFRAIQAAYHGLASEPLRYMIGVDYPELNYQTDGDGMPIKSPPNGVRERTRTGTREGKGIGEGMQGGRSSDRLPTLEEARARAAMIGGSEDDGEAFWNHFEASGWVDKNGNQIAKWGPKLATWLTTNRAKQANGSEVGGAQLIAYQKEFDRIERRISTIKSGYEPHQTINAEDRDKLKKLRTRAAELKKLLGVEI